MRIISKFQDYYDSAAIYGIDKAIVFQRDFLKIETNECKGIGKIKSFIDDFSGQKGFNHPHFFRKQHCRTYGERLKTVKLFSSVFSVCGKIYFGLCYAPGFGGKLINEYRGEHFSDLPLYGKPVFIMEETALNKLEEQMKLNIADHTIFNDKTSEYHEVLQSINYIRDKLLPEIVNLNNNAEKLDLSELHFEYNSPLLMFTNSALFECQINPELRQYGIQSIVDAPTMNQEISMFISGVLGNTEKETIKISDKDKIIGKGFDYKSSFRKEKAK